MRQFSYEYEKWEGQLIYIVILFAVFVLSFYFIHRRRVHILSILDDFYDNKDGEAIQSAKVFKSILATGFTYSHPCCIDYDVFTFATQAWPEQLGVWSTFAKFAAIYPEMTQTLGVISKSIVANNFRGKIADTVHSCISDIVKTRETNLIPDLKSKLTKISRLSLKTKNKLRNIWDLVLQGNTHELENAIHSAYHSVHTLDLEFEHLISLYPNNRFASRVYARYFMEIRADHKNYQIWRENTQTLQRGLRIKTDAIQELAFIVFPTLPLNVNDQTTQLTGGFSEVSTEEFLTDDDKSDGSESIVNLVNSHKLQSINYIYITSTIQLVLFILFPIIFLCFYFEVYSSEIEGPLTVMYGISFVRNMLNMITAFIGDYLMTKIDDPADGGKLMNVMSFTAKDTMSSLGGNKDVDDILQYLIQRVISLNEYINPLRNYKEGNTYVDKARSCMFDSLVEYRFFTGKGKNTTTSIGAESVAPMVSAHAAKLLKVKTVTAATLFTTDCLTALNNNDAATKQMNRALSALIDYIYDENGKNQSTYTYVLIGLVLFTVVSSLIIYTIQGFVLQSHKERIHHVLFTLPKTTISTISASFYSLKKKDSMSNSIADSSVTDMNKQEENIVKVFNAISENHSSNTVLAGVLEFFIMLFACLAFYFITDCYKTADVKLVDSAPHIDYLLGSSSFIFAAISKLFKIAVDQKHTSFNGLVTDLNEEKNLIYDDIGNQVKYFNNLRFGPNEEDSYPFSGMEKALERANTIVECADKYAPATTFREGAYCFDSEGQIYLVTSYIMKFVGQMDKKYYLKPKGENLAQCFQVGTVMIYESFFYPTAKEIVQTIRDEIGAQRPMIIIYAVVFAVLDIIVYLIVLMAAHIEGEYLRFTLQLLLHCPAKIVLSSPKIVALLNGDYSIGTEDTTSRNADFYDDIVNRLNDVVIVTNIETEEITGVNNAFVKCFKRDRKDIVGSNIRTFLSSSEFSGAAVDDILEKNCDIVRTDNGEKTYFSTSPITVNGQKIIISRNETMRVMHELLISEEKKKSDAMLSSILPPSLVPRVQAGEKNISFAVQSVSVTFMDIVSFTPWCGSHDAAYVMKTLNIIFKENDALVATHKTLSKIKCIGDCYMAAGGIFDEVNNPAQHAKEMVEFGVEAIKKIVEIDENMDEQLRIRVGINTGGPIVAGVLGTDKPTFEILGPTINIAQQMEHHGVPMLVHISRPVYELIYGGSFQIKERGEIEVKNGKMFTYLVTPPPRQPPAE